MKNFLLASVLALAALSNIGCSNQWRESDPGVDGDAAMALFDEISQGGQQKGLTVNALQSLQADPYSTLYFAESGKAMGPVPSVFSFVDTSFLGTMWGWPLEIGTNVFDLDLSYVGVIFLDAKTEDGQRYFTLMMKLVTPQVSTPEYFIAQSQPNQYSLDNKKFQVVVSQNGTNIILRSFDVSKDYEDQLGNTIQLKANILEGGVEYELGQFSVLHGFGGTQ